MLTETERKKMREDFLIRLGGALTGGLEKTAFEVAWKAYGLSGQFPYVQPHPKLAPYDNWIVAGLSIPPWVIGALMEEDGKKRGDIKAKELGKNVKMFGEGDVCYAIPKLIQENLRWLATPIIGHTEARVAGRRTAGAGRPARRSDVGHKIIKL